MNGQERAALQRRAGVRNLVEDIDALKLLLGVGNVKILTPKAETTLRKGEKAKIPLVLTCFLADQGMEVTLAFPIGYPAAPFEVQSTEYVSERRSFDEETKAQIHELCSSFECRDLLGVSSPFEIIQYIKNIPHFGSITDDATSEIVDVGVEGSAEGAAPPEQQADRTGPEVQSSYRSFACRMCRTTLFSDFDLDEHNTNRACQTLFLSDPQHDSEDDSQQGGKIACPICKTKLGAWSWIGTQCSCKEWVIPAFHIPASKLDVNYIDNSEVPTRSVIKIS